MSRSAAVTKARHSGRKSALAATGAKRPTGGAARVRGEGTLRKAPRQQRSKQMVEAILQAAAEVFAAQGYARATTNKIAERAGVSVGSLYQYFPDKDSLLARLLALHHAEVDEVVRRALGRLADPTTPLQEGLRRFLTELVALHRADPALTRALSAAVLRQSSVADEIHKGDDEAVQLSQVAALLAARPDVRQGDHLAMAAVLGQSTAQLTRWLVHDAPPVAAPETLLEEVVQLLVRYLVDDRGQGESS